MKHKKIMTILGLSLISACGVALFLLGARTDKERNLARLPLPSLFDCSSSSHPQLPERFRATYLMAPFSIGQLMLAEIVHDGPLSATRLTLYGIKNGVADFLVKGDKTYVLPIAKTGGKNCTDLGDTGWRPLPADWLTDASRCAGSGPVLKVAVNWWTTAIEPAPSSYWVLSKHSDGTPFRLVFANPSDKFLALSRFALSHLIAFEALERSDLSEIASSCKTAPRPKSAGAKGLNEAIDAMAHSTLRDDEAIARLFPGLKYPCSVLSEDLWTKKLGLTGMLTPFDSGQDPVPMEVLYDWSVPAQRSRIFPRQGDIAAHDYLMLKEGGYNVTYRSDGAALCIPGLPGALRPDWAQRAPCECSAQIDAGTAVTPDEPIKILSCPLNMPRIAWAWYTSSGRPTVFMVTSKPGDQGSRSFAIVDYHEWSPNLPMGRATFAAPKDCPDSPIVPAGMPTGAIANCITCHSAGAAHLYPKVTHFAH